MGWTDRLEQLTSLLGVWKREPWQDIALEASSLSVRVASEYLSGDTRYGLAKRHDVTRNLIRVWVRKHEEGAFDEDAQTVEIVREHDARIAALVD